MSSSGTDAEERRGKIVEGDPRDSPTYTRWKEIVTLRMKRGVC